MNCINLDTCERPKGYRADLIAKSREEVVGTKTAAEIEADFLRTYLGSQEQSRPEGGLTVEEMAKAAKTSHGTIRRWLATQTGYKTVVGIKKYATRKQSVTYYVKQ